MSADWIKMRTDLYRDPKVCLIADQLMDPEGELARYVDQYCQRNMAVTRNVMRNVTVGALVTVWGVMRHRGKRVNDDLLCKRVTISIIDDIADLPGFGEAMESAGWATETEEGVVFPGFFNEYNVEPSVDAKKSNAERQRRYREKRNALRDVTVTSQSNAREEKRREENIYKLRGAHSESERFRNLFFKFVNTTQDAYRWIVPEETLMNWDYKLNDLSLDDAIASLDHSIERGNRAPKFKGEWKQAGLLSSTVQTEPDFKPPKPVKRAAPLEDLRQGVK